MKKQQKILIEQKKKKRLEKRKHNNLLKENKMKNKKLRGKNVRRKLILSSEESEDDEVPYVDTDNEESSYDEECIFCQELYSNDKNGESWIKCIKCGRWAHELCAGVECWKTFNCEFCRKNIL